MNLLVLVFCSFAGVMCYYPSGKENFLSGLLLRDLVSRITHGKPEMSSNGEVSYLDFTGEDEPLPLNGKALSRELEEEQMFPLDYDSLGDINMHPSIRDQEYLQHSSLWGNRYNLGPSDTNSLSMLQSIKFNKQNSESTLPAYCNPPNPCPVGYTEDQGCITNFENTASFSRRYQGMQDCMCDSEHMFDCPNMDISGKERSMDSMSQMDFSRMLQQSLKLEGYPHKNLVAKKFHSYIEKDSSDDDVNPFLTGEKLPVAAKKGINAF